MRVIGVSSDGDVRLTEYRNGVPAIDKRPIPVLKPPDDPANGTADRASTLPIPIPRDLTGIAPIVILQARNREEITWQNRSWKQKRISFQERSQMIDVMRHAQYELDLGTPALYMFFQIFDRYLERADDVKPNDLFAIAATCLVLAGKVEGVNPFLAEYLTFWEREHPGRVDRWLILELELEILNVVEFNFTEPTILFWLTLFQDSVEIGREEFLLGRYGSELAMTIEQLYTVPPAMVAAASLAFARHLVRKRPPWPKELSDFTGFSVETVAVLMDAMLRAARTKDRAESKHMREVYSTRDWGFVARRIRPKEERPEASAS